MGRLLKPVTTHPGKKYWSRPPPPRSFTPTKGRGWGAEKFLAMLKRGAQSFEVVLVWELEVLAIVMVGGPKGFHPLKKRGGGEAQKVLPCLEGGGEAQKVLVLRFFHFLAPTPVINDWSLIQIRRNGVIS